MVLSLAMTEAVKDTSLGTRIVVDTFGYALRLGVALFLVKHAADPRARLSSLLWFDARRWKADLKWGVGAVVIGGTVVTLLIAVGICILLLTGARLPGPTPADQALLSRQGLLANGHLLAGITLVALVGAPIVEEVIYRGVLIPPMLERVTPGVAAALNGALFGFLHVVPYGHGGLGELEVLGGVFMALAFWLRRSLLVAMILHAAGNAYLALVAVLVVLASEQRPSLFAPYG